jgi:hypothetical protein
LRALCEFLGLEAEDGYLRDCSRLLFDKPRQSRFQVQWTPKLVAAVHAGIQRYPFLRKYESCGDLMVDRRKAA